MHILNVQVHIKSVRLKKILFHRIWKNQDTKENFCAGKGNAHINKRQLNQNYYKYNLFILLKKCI